MNDSVFDQDLDAMAMGREPAQQDDLTRFVAGIYRKERAVTMPYQRRMQLASVLGDSEATITSPVASRARKSRRFPWFAVAAAVLLAMTGVFNWSLPSGDHQSRFLGVPSAIPTVQATPVAMVSPNAEWLMPISPYDCDVLAEELTMPGSLEVELREYPPRQNYPIQPVRYAARMDAWQGARDIRACLNPIGVQSFWSERYLYEQSVMPSVDPDGYEELSVDRIRRGLVVSDLYGRMLSVSPEDLVLRFDVGDPEVAGLDPGTYPVVNPDWILGLPDGRMIVLVTALVVSDGELPLVTPDSSQPGGLVWVLIENDGVWRIDEGLPVCIGDEDECLSFWRRQPGWGAYYESRIPQATPDNAACTIPTDFRADYRVDAGRSVNLRPGPGIQSGDPVVVVEDGQTLTYLCQNELTSDPDGDDLHDDQGWLFVRTEDGVEGWIREVDVRAVPVATLVDTQSDVWGGVL